jgi:hypothetical protein
MIGGHVAARSHRLTSRNVRRDGRRGCLQLLALGQCLVLYHATARNLDRDDGRDFYGRHLQSRIAPGIGACSLPRKRCRSDGQFLQFDVQRTSVNGSIKAPLWFIALLMLLTAWRVRRRKKYLPGMCVRCGYDLRATAESGGQLLDVCPECGEKRDHHQGTKTPRRAEKRVGTGMNADEHR